MRRILGNVGSFKLPNGKYGFGRIFESPCVAFYKHIGETEKDVPPIEDYAFIVCVYSYAVTEMKMVEKRKFESIEEVAHPLMYIKDPISKEFFLYIDGEMHPSTREECRNLEVCAVWDLDHVGDRLMGNDIWNDKEWD